MWSQSMHEGGFCLASLELASEGEVGALKAKPNSARRRSAKCGRRIVTLVLELRLNSLLLPGMRE